MLMLHFGVKLSTNQSSDDAIKSLELGSYDDKIDLKYAPRSTAIRADDQGCMELARSFKVQTCPM